MSNIDKELQTMPKEQMEQRLRDLIVETASRQRQLQEDTGLCIAMAAVDTALKALELHCQSPSTDPSDAISFDVAWKMPLNEELTRARRLSGAVRDVFARIPSSMCNEAGEFKDGEYLKEADVRVLREMLHEAKSKAQLQEARSVVRASDHALARAVCEAIVLQLTQPSSSSFETAR